MTRSATCHTGKYEPSVDRLCHGDPGFIPENFKYSDKKLVTHREPTSPETVIGRIWAVVEEHQPITGRELVRRLMRENWRGHPSAYVEGDIVCSLWLIGYVQGMVRTGNEYLKVKSD